MIRVAVAVVGDGPAGAAVALALLARGVEVAVVGGWSTPRVGEHLAPSAWPSIEALALGPRIDTEQHRPSPGVASAWGGGEEKRRDYLFQPWRCGLNLDRAAFDRQLLDEVARRGGLLLPGRSNWTLVRIDKGWQLSNTCSSVIESSFLVDATGRRAWVARRLGGRVHRVDRLVALWVRLRSASTPLDASLRLKALPTGWCYAAPLADGTIAAAYLTDADLLSGSSCPKSVWVEQLRTALTPMFALDVNVDGKIQVVPACSQLVQPAAGIGWMAVGDAAMAFDPLSSVGIPKALTDGLQAADAIELALAGDFAKLECWNTACRSRFGAFLATRRTYYQLERRWPDENFWHRRQA